MPHKVNPIDFENGEGNLGLANSLSDHFANKLPISRFQRDLSDSTVLRSLGTFFAHCLVAYESVLGGLARIELDRAALGREVSSSWVLMAEPIQTILRLFFIFLGRQIK